MQGLYTGCAEDVQALDERALDTANILDLADPDEATVLPPGPRSKSPPRETSAMRARMEAAMPRATLKQAIIREWLTGCYDADTAIYWLRAFKLVGSPYRGDPYDLMVMAAQAEFPGVALPERGIGHIPSVSSREPFAPVSQEGGAA